MFLDRDGTLNAHVLRVGRRSSPRGLQEWTLLPETSIALARLRAAGARLVVVTNQPDLSRGLIRRDALDGLHQRLAAQVHLDAVLVCPHQASERCRCRKPSSYWLHHAARHLQVDLGASYFIGDRATDAQTGLNAGLRVVLLTAGRGVSDIPGLRYANGLSAAATEILRDRGQIRHHH